MGATGHKIKNVGQKTIEWRSKVGDLLATTFQLTAVGKPLLSVSQMQKMVVETKFGPREAWIKPPGGRRIASRKEAGVWMLDMKLEAPFRRQGK